MHVVRASLRGPRVPIPLLDSIEWHLSASRHAAWLIDHAIHGPRRWARSARQPPLDLARFERSVFSQNGEDGILEEIFRRVGPGSKKCIEFGYDPQCCTRRLIVQDRWCGLLIDGAPWIRDWASPEFAGSDSTLVQAFITRDNIVELLSSHGAPSEPDLLVVDIDGNDYWVLMRILERYTPRIVVCEYNARWAPPSDWVMPYNPGHSWDGSAIQRTSLVALDRAMRARRYILVACDSRGVNAFFVREEYAHMFPDAGLPVAAIYRAPRFARGYGHPIRVRHGFVTPLRTSHL